MLNKYAHRNIELISTTALRVWDEYCEFGEIKIKKSPYPEFEWMMKLYGQYGIRLVYDRSILVIEVPTKNGYTELSNVSEEKVFHFFDSLKPENLLHNFQVLDRLLRKQM